MFPRFCWIEENKLCFWISWRDWWKLTKNIQLAKASRQTFRLLSSSESTIQWQFNLLTVVKSDDKKFIESQVFVVTLTPSTYQPLLCYLVVCLAIRQTNYNSKKKYDILHHIKWIHAHTESPVGEPHPMSKHLDMA